MIRNIYIIGLALCFAFAGQSCLHGDLEDCPPMVNYAVAFKYIEHLERRDRFYDDVKKINFFVFDKDSLVYKVDTVVGRFESPYTLPLNLPMGKYTLVTWGNVLESQPFNFTTSFVKGVTTLEEARLALNKTAGTFCDKSLEKLFFGERQIEIPLYVNRIDTVPLVNDTKNIRVVVHWDHSDYFQSSEELIPYEEVEVQLSGTNAYYNFHNDSLLRNDSRAKVIYQPYKKYIKPVEADSALRLGKSFTDNLPSLKLYDEQSYEEQIVRKSVRPLRTTVYDFSVLRLYKDVPLTLTIQINELNRGSASLHKLIEDHNIINGTDGCQIQFADSLDRRNVPFGINWRKTFDENDYYQVDVYIYQDRPTGTFVTGQFKIYNWWLIHYEGSGGR